MMSHSDENTRWVMEWNHSHTFLRTVCVSLNWIKDKSATEREEGGALMGVH